MGRCGCSDEAGVAEHVPDVAAVVIEDDEVGAGEAAMCCFEELAPVGGFCVGVGDEQGKPFRDLPQMRLALAHDPAPPENETT